MTCPECGREFSTEQARNGHYGTAHVRVYANTELIHGTTAGYRKHLKRMEKPCSECKQAWRNKKRENR